MLHTLWREVESRLSWLQAQAPCAVHLYAGSRTVRDLTQPVRHYSVLACSRYAFCVTVRTFLEMPDHVTLGLEFADLFGGTVSGNMTR